MEMRMTGRLPMHIARGIQNRLPTPRANTDQAIRSVRGPKPTRNSVAKSTNPVVIPDYVVVRFFRLALARLEHTE